MRQGLGGARVQGRHGGYRGCVSGQCNVSSKAEGGYTCEGDLAQQLVPIPAGFPIDFLGMLAWKVANGYHMITGLCNWS